MSPDLTDASQLPSEKVPLRSLSLTGSDSPRRSGENAQHVRALAEVQGRLPPIIVHRKTMRVIDGMHRLRAAQVRGDKEIEVRFFDGDEGSAYILAVKSNVAHGLPLTLADRKAAATRIMRLYPEWSDRRIAAIAGVAPNTVASIRPLCTIRGGCPSDQTAQLDSRVGRDGRRRPQNAGERREFAARLLRENPGASLREIARRAGISAETVRSVRAMEAASNHGEEVRANIPRPRGKRALNFLRADPAFRSTESGRSLLRLLAFPELADRHGDALAAQIPAHCLGNAATAALECAAAWRMFASEAEALRRRDGSSSRLRRS